MALIIIGVIIRGIGAAGLAGSGIILDPKKAKEDLEPYARMGGGLLKDALSEAEIPLGKGEVQRIVMVKCKSCGELNDEDAKFCKKCGQGL
jgi:hypothetical protein